MPHYWMMATTVVLGLTTAAAYPAQANDRSIRGVSIPATSCQVDENEPFEANPIKTITVISRFTPGFYTVVCPFQVNEVELGGTSNDNDMNQFRITYVDSDGLGPDAQVRVDLHRTTFATDGRQTDTIICRWDSNVQGTPGAVRARVPCVEDIRLGGFYSFALVLKAGGDDEARFYGIDFP